MLRFENSTKPQPPIFSILYSQNPLVGYWLMDPIAELALLEAQPEATETPERKEFISDIQDP